MFNKCIEILLAEINSYITSRMPEGIVSKTPVMYIQQNNQAAAKGTRVSVRLVDILEEKTSQDPTTYVPQGNRYFVKKMPLYFNMHLLFMVCSEDCNQLESLDYLARVIAFFQSKSYFSSKETPSLQQLAIDTLTVTLINMDYQERTNLWASLSMPYVPSVMYKIGLIPIADMPAIWPTVPSITTIAIE